MSANEEDQHHPSQDEADDYNVVYGVVAQVPPEYERDEFICPYISSEGDSVHLHPRMVYTKTADGTKQAELLPPDMIAKSIDIWKNDLDDDDYERLFTLSDAFSEVICNDAPPAPGGESSMEVKGNVIVPLQVNNVNNADEETDSKKPSWLVLRHYPTFWLEGLAKSFGGDEDPSIAESINKTCPSLDHKPQFLVRRPGTPLGVDTNITHEGSKYHITPSCLIGNFLAESHRTHHGDPDYQNTFTTGLLEGINHCIAESFIRDEQVMKDNNTYTSYKDDAANSETLELKLNADLADDRGFPKDIFITTSHSFIEDVTGRSSTELGAGPSQG
ncbi:hypothetical protein L202_05870 [Cryptococcus amylolentus CBS 6039]|uniref:Uncharacterized protein n=2 Tax=Cryptococcus amylolentus TaxID=104669 RepID=A0A1E3HHQ2_9TREE|nr:hypothetical protein L202_05870 [Cryptococcus amylolentus CBS 6039]ODN75882.1 hypothetical protein L202_05870 [Cryptococcus amylolentus CBS 6039]ODN97028.1 hypothetical protein I350_08006 [Cryptococcus amylolentus CBS 6273]